MFTGFADAGRRIAGRSASRVAAAAILGQVADKAVHHRVVRRVDELASQPSLADESGVEHLLQMEGERGRWHLQPLGNLPGGKTLRPSFNQQPVDGKPVIVGDGGKRRDNLVGIHGATFR